MTKFPHSGDINVESLNIPLLAATSAAMLTLMPIAAHQVGLLSHLPDPASRLFASDEITESNSAYPFGIPDGLLGLASYSTTVALVLLAPRCPLVRKLLTAKLLADGTVAAVNVIRQITTFGRLCSWCTATALCTGAMVIAGRRVRSQPPTQYLRSDLYCSYQ